MALRMRNGFIRRRADDVISEVDHVQEREHFVHIYHRDGELAEGVARFLAVGFAQGNFGVVLATSEHIAAIDQQLRLAGVEPDLLRKSGQYSPFQAGEILDRVIIDGVFQPGRFDAGIVGAWLKAAAKSGRGIRAFGELVSILAGDGNVEAAIALEQHWNELGQIHEFTLYCGYSANIAEGIGEDSYRHICREHSRVIRAPLAEPSIA